MSLGEIGAEEVASRLGFPPGTKEAEYVEELSAEPEPSGFEPLRPSEAAELLGRLGVSKEEAEDVIATLPDPVRSPEWWWCCERAASRIVRHMGDPDQPRGAWPSFEGPSYDLARRCHFTHVALLVAPHTVAYYRRLGVGEELAWAALDDIARHMAIHRRVFGLTGIDAAWWMTLCLRGELVDLGRLQYNRFHIDLEGGHLWYPPEEAEARGPGFRQGDDCLGVHIPESGPLLPELVDESLAMAGDFFSRYYPVEKRRVATCSSWLLDPQLAEYLPASSNIISFQRRFELVPGHYDGDEDVLQFVFRVPGDTPLGTLSQRTRLERAIVGHLGAGRHFAVRNGWLELAS